MKRDRDWKSVPQCGGVNQICQKRSFQFLSSSVCVCVCLFVCVFLSFFWGFGLATGSAVFRDAEALSNILHVSFANHQVARREGSMGQYNIARLHMNLWWKLIPRGRSFFSLCMLWCESLRFVEGNFWIGKITGYYTVAQDPFSSKAKGRNPTEQPEMKRKTM